MTTDVGRNYVADKYPELTIIDGKYFQCFLVLKKQRFLWVI